MKKTLVTLLALVFVLGIAGTALAAPANPFVDVPAKHWAYGAVAKLAKAGVIDGYGDGTFRGDRTMTRYEMAQAVAKAMAKSEKADAEMKALIDKLAVEFAAELNNLGVRVAKLEAKTNVAWGVETRVRFVTDSPPSGVAKIEGSDKFEWRVRLHLNADVNESTKFTARLESTGTKFGDTTATNNDLKVNRAFMTTKGFLGLDEVKWGRMPLYYGQAMLVGKTGNNDGIAISHKMGDVTANFVFADIAASSAGGNGNEFGMLQLAFAPAKNFDVNVGYYNNTSPMYASWDSAASTATKSKGFDIGVAVGMGDFTLLGEYVATKLTNGAAGEKTSPKAFAIQIANSKAKMFYSAVNLVDYKKPGTDGFAISYRSIEANALPWGLSGFEGTAVASGATAAGQSSNIKGYYLTYQNVIAKNMILSLEYQDLKKKSHVSGTEQNVDKTFQASIQAWF